MRELKLLVIGLGLMVILSPVFGRAKEYPPLSPWMTRPLSIQGEVTDKPAYFWHPGWIGCGELRRFTICNTLQGGVISQPWDWEYFTIDYPMAVFNLPFGLCGEYPAGSGQLYNWAAGAWVGAKYPIVEDGDTTAWVPNVSKMAYYSDLGAMSVPEMEDVGGQDISLLGLYFSDMRLHKGDDYLFVQPGMSPKGSQALWPFADTLLNARRPEGMKLNPAEGDIVSIQDTYAVGGDWIPADDATVLWIRSVGGPYEFLGLGIRVEQRTYSWNYDYNNAYLYLNWKIRNMNPFPLKDVYVGYFMDNDVGSGIEDPENSAWDDMIGFDRELNLGYSYDSDAYEPGWIGPAGYIGSVILETPGDIGMTGFQTWLYGDSIDDARDDLKYKALKAEYGPDSFMVWTIPRDVRQLSCSGPYPELGPGEEVDFTVAVVVALSLDELKGRARYAQAQFQSGYVGFAPPPSPRYLSLVPGDGRVYLSWDGSPEGYLDPMTGEYTFEGYRVYRSRTGLSGEWELLAEYDRAGSRFNDTVTVKYTSGTSRAEIEFVGFDALGGQEFYRNNRYALHFLTDSTYMIYNLDSAKVYSYNPDARAQGIGYYVVDPLTGEWRRGYPADPGYISGSQIYMDGFYISITDGEFDPEQPGADLTPNSGDLFEIRSYVGEELGGQTGLRYFCIDSTVTNGITYYYSVTSYSRPLHTLGIPSMESAQSGKQYWAIPRKQAVDWTGARVDTLARTRGANNVKVEAMVVQPEAVTGHRYRLNFLSADDDEMADYWRLTDLTDARVVLDSVGNLEGELSSPIGDGLLIRVDAVREVGIDTETVWDTLQTGWIAGDCNYSFSFSVRDLEPWDYEISFPAEGDTDVYGRYAPFTVRNVTLNEPLPFIYTDYAPKDTLSADDAIRIHRSPYAPGNRLFTMTVKVDPAVPPILPKEGDVYLVKTLKPVTPEDEFEISTTALTTPKSDYSLDSIRVVPNPYYIRAPWDKSRFDRKVWFQGLPSRCTIRIFNAAGLLIRTEGYEGTGAWGWNLKTDEEFDAVSGLYIYQVVTEDGKSAVGKFAIVR